jgi:hypothetical protein
MNNGRIHNRSCGDADASAFQILIHRVQHRKDRQLANRPRVTALNLMMDLPRSVRGPVERLAFFRLATIFNGVTVLTHRILSEPPGPICPALSQY